MITAALERIGGNTKPEELAQAAQQCAANTVQFVWSVTHHAPSNANLHKANESWKAAVDELLRLQSRLIVTVLNGRLYFDDVQQPKADEAVNNFVKTATDRRIRKVIIRRDATNESLEDFGNLLQVSPEDLKAAGGLAKYCAGSKLDGITITEVRQLPGDEPRGGRGYWERKFDDVGLDPHEILSLFSSRSHRPKMIAAEMTLLAEAMKNNQLLSQLLLRVAQIDATRGPDPAELLRACKRAQYFLLLHGGHDDEQITQMLSKAIQSYDAPFRLALYRAQLALQHAGAETFDDRFLALQPTEYAEYIVRGRERDGDWRKYIEPIRMTRGEAMNIARAVEARLWTSSKLKVDAVQTANEIEALEKNLNRELECPIVAPIDQPLPSAASADQAMAALHARAANFVDDIGEAYTHILLHLYYSALDGIWARNLLDRLVLIVEDRLQAHRYADVISLVRAVCDERHGSERVAASKGRLREICRNAPKDELIKFFSEKLGGGDHQLMNIVPEIVDLFGEDVFEKMILSLLGRETDHPSPIAVGLLARHRKLMCAILTRLAEDGNPWVRVRCYELLCSVRDPHAQDVALKGLADRNGSVRYLAYLAMGKGASQRGIAQLLETATARQKTGKIIVYKDCCAAITSLGNLRCQQAIPVLQTLLKSKHLRRMPFYDLKLCAALALRKISTTEAVTILHRELPDIDATAITVITRRIKRIILAPFRPFMRKKAAPPSPAAAQEPAPLEAIATTDISAMTTLPPPSSRGEAP